MLGVSVRVLSSMSDKVKDTPVTLDLNQATGKQAFDAISHQAKASWGIVIDQDARVVMIFQGTQIPLL
jgi:hypothetical protein